MIINDKSLAEQNSVIQSKTPIIAEMKAKFATSPLYTKCYEHYVQGAMRTVKAIEDGKKKGLAIDPAGFVWQAGAIPTAIEITLAQEKKIQASNLPPEVKKAYHIETAKMLYYLQTTEDSINETAKEKAPGYQSDAMTRYESYKNVAMGYGYASEEFDKRCKNSNYKIPGIPELENFELRDERIAKYVAHELGRFKQKNDQNIRDDVMTMSENEIIGRSEEALPLGKYNPSISNQQTVESVQRKVAQKLVGKRRDEINIDEIRNDFMRNVGNVNVNKASIDEFINRINQSILNMDKVNAVTTQTTSEYSMA